MVNMVPRENLKVGGNEITQFLNYEYVGYEIQIAKDNLNFELQKSFPLYSPHIELYPSQGPRC